MLKTIHATGEDPRGELILPPEGVFDDPGRYMVALYEVNGAEPISLDEVDDPDKLSLRLPMKGADNDRGWVYDQDPFSVIQIEGVTLHGEEISIERATRVTRGLTNKDLSVVLHDVFQVDRITRDTPLDDAARTEAIRIIGQSDPIEWPFTHNAREQMMEGYSGAANNPNVAVPNNLAMTVLNGIFGAQES